MRERENIVSIFTEKEKRAESSSVYNNVLLAEGCSLKQFKKAAALIKGATEIRTVNLTECDIWELKYIDDKDVVMFDRIPPMDTENIVKMVDAIEERRVSMDEFRKAGAEDMIKNIARPECTMKTVFVHYDESNNWAPEYYFFSSMAQQAWNDCMPATELQSSLIRDLYLANFFARHDGTERADGAEKSLTTLHFLTRRTPGSSVYRVSNIWKTKKARGFDYDGLYKAVENLMNVGNLHFARGFEMENGYSSLSICFDGDEQNGVYPVYGLTWSDATKKANFMFGYNNPDLDDIDWEFVRKIGSVTDFENEVIRQRKATA